MNYFDVFNGDADGICSLHQLRLAQPRDAHLITGTKCDISLLDRILKEKGNAIAVFDISMDVIAMHWRSC